MDIQPLINHFENYQPLNEEEQTALKDKVKLKRVKRRQFILQEGDICKHYSFVVEGCFKMYKVDEKGNEHNLQFAIEDGWIADLGSFHAEKPSQLYIESIEKSTIFQLSKQDLLFLYSNFNAFDRNFRVLVENAFINLQKRVLQNISSSAEERYLDFLEKYPHLFNRISNVQIASYIGVTPEFLSNVRKKLAGK